MTQSEHELEQLIAEHQDKVFGVPTSAFLTAIEEQGTLLFGMPHGSPVSVADADAVFRCELLDIWAAPANESSLRWTLTQTSVQWLSLDKHFTSRNEET